MAETPPPPGPSLDTVRTDPDALPRPEEEVADASGPPPDVPPAAGGAAGGPPAQGEGEADSH